MLRGAEVYVLRVKADNKVEKDTGIGLGTMVEVIGDVSDGDCVIVRGAERLQLGQTVAVIDIRCGDPASTRYPGC